MSPVTLEIDMDWLTLSTVALIAGAASLAVIASGGWRALKKSSKSDEGASHDRD